MGVFISLYGKEGEIKMRDVVGIIYTDEGKKRVEELIFRKTGKKLEIGPLDYGGKYTLLTFKDDLTKINKINVTCAMYFTGIHFHSEEKFIQWVEDNYEDI